MKSQSDTILGKKSSPALENEIAVTPISHATMVLAMGAQVIYVDPVGGVAAFEGQPHPSLILVTDIHQDHFDPETLREVSGKETTIVTPKAVADKLPDDIRGKAIILKNGEKKAVSGIEIEAIPMYNIPHSENSFHTKGRGNGYVLESNDTRVYIAGDTSGIPEMRELKDIDVAFVPMNLPYTMDVEEAAASVIAFAPKVVHPYHYRGKSGFSDRDTFKALVLEKDPNIKVELLDFYPGQ